MGISRFMVSQIPLENIDEEVLSLGNKLATSLGLDQHAFALVFSWLLLCAAVDIALSVYLTCYLVSLL